MTTFIEPPFWSPRFARQWRNHISTALVTPPDGEPLALDDAKAALRVNLDVHDEDALIASYITSARAYVEHQTALALQPQTWDVTYDRLPFFGLSLPLPLRPITSITSITTVDLTDMATAMDPATYRLDGKSDPPRVSLAAGIFWWPQSLRRIDAATLRAVVGFEAVPGDLLQAMRLLVAHFFENRVAADVGLRFDATLPIGVSDLLDPYRPVGVA